MKTLKKATALFLSLTVAAGVLAGCGSTTDQEADTATPETSTTTPAQDTQTAESNVDKALALINTFATGDTETAAQLLDENYIQHNLAYGTGEDAFLASVEGLAAADAETTVENIRAFEDGDYVFLQNVYNFAGAGEQVAFDIFRFDEDGEIAEHWDNLAALATEPNPSGHTQIDGTTEVTDLDQTEDNRDPGGELPLRCDAGQQPRQDRRLLRRGHLHPAQHRHRRRRFRPERGSGRPGPAGHPDDL